MLDKQSFTVRKPSPVCQTKRMLSVSNNYWCWCWRRIFLHRCKHCRIPFPRLGQLLSHLNRHGTGQPYACEECHKVFHSFVVYRRHRRVFLGEKIPLTFELIDPGIAYRSELRLHFDRQKSMAEALVSGVRVKKVLNVENRLWHMPAAQKCGVQIPVIVSSATSRTRKTADLSKNVEIELNKAGTYSCPCCSKTFPLICQLKDHVQTHSSDRPHKCAKCHKCYKRNAHLEEHIRTVHEGSRPYR